MVARLQFPDQRFYSSVMKSISANENVEVEVIDSKVSKWLIWYLPFLLNEKRESSGFWKTLYSFFVLRRFHSVFGEVFSRAGNIFYSRKKDGGLILFFSFTTSKNEDGDAENTERQRRK